MAAGRFVAEIPVRLSQGAEKRALRRMSTAQRVSNDVLADYLARIARYQRDGELKHLRAEYCSAKGDGKKTVVPASVVPRRVSFDDAFARNAAWAALQERHGLIGAKPVASLTPSGLEHVRADQAANKRITAAMKDLGDRGIGADLVHNEIVVTLRARALAYVHGKTGRPRFASRRFPLTGVSGSSSSKNVGSIRVNLREARVIWVAAAGKYPIVGKLRIDEGDAWLAKALKRKIHQVRLLHRVIRGMRRWFVQLVLEGLSPLNPKLRDARMTGVTGIDLGVRHLAYVTVNHGSVVDAGIRGLAPTAERRELTRDHAIEDLRDGDRWKRDRYVRRLRRAVGQKILRNPANAHAVKRVPKLLTKTSDGKAVGRTADVATGWKRGSKLVRSASVRNINAKIAEIARADAAARDVDHGRLANQLLVSGETIALEDLSYRVWQQLYGSSTSRSAVGAFVERLRRRAPILARTIVDISPMERLSQVCHVCGTLNRYRDELSKPIAARTSRCEGCDRVDVQLDTYSAFLAASCGGGTSVDPQVAKAMWAGAVMHLVSARQTYDRAAQSAKAWRRAQAQRPSRQSTSPPASHSSLRRLRSETRVQPDDGPRALRRPDAEQSARGRSTHAGRAIAPDSAASQDVTDPRVQPPLDSLQKRPLNKVTVFVKPSQCRTE